MAIRRFACAVGVLLVASAAARAADEPWTFERLVAATQWREDQFKNCSFQFTEDASRTRNEAVTSTLTVDVKVRFPLTRCRYDYNFAPDAGLNIVGTEWACDGKTSIVMGRRSTERKRTLRALVQEPRPDFLRKKSFELMGTLYPDERVSVKLLEAVRRAEAKVTVGEAFDQGEKVVTVRIVATSFGCPISTYTFLPEKDMLMHRYRETYFTDDVQRASPASDETVSVPKCERRDGIWIPIETLCDRDAGVGKASFTYRVTAFAHSAPAAAEFPLAIPPGTVVNDRIEGSVYQVESDGSHTQRPFFDGDTGRVVEPSATQRATTKPAVKAGG